MVLLLFLSGATAAHSQELVQAGFDRIEDFIQKSSAAPEYNGPGAFSIYAYLQASSASSIKSAALESPDGQSHPLQTLDDPTRMEFSDYYDNPVQEELDYPPGLYRLGYSQNTSTTLDIPVPDTFFPNAPRILNWEASQQARADQPFDLRWEPFSEGTTNDLIRVTLYDVDGNKVFTTPDQPGAPAALNGTTTTCVIPAGTLDHGAVYQAFLVFARVASAPHAAATVSFVRRTEFVYQTSGTQDLPKLKLDFSFSFSAYAGDFRSDLTPAISFPVDLDDCHVARLAVRDEDFLPAVSDVTFTSPPGTIFTNTVAAYRYDGQEAGFYFESPCLEGLPLGLPGAWTVGYNHYPLPFQAPDPRTRQRLTIPLPLVQVETNILKAVSWSFHDPTGKLLDSAPAFITNLVVAVFSRANFLVYNSTNLAPSDLGVKPPTPIEWDDVGGLTIGYQDDLGNWYSVTYDHSPPSGLDIASTPLPLGSIDTPYRGQMTATNGLPPYRWSVDGGKLPPGLALDPASGFISGSPTARGTFRFFIRVDDQAKAFEQDQFFITITTNGPPVILTQPAGGNVDVGDYTIFEVEAEGTQPLSYQWLFENKEIPGQTNRTFELENIDTAQTGNYTVRVSNALGSLLSASARLTVLSPPVILKQPSSQTVNAGANVTFQVEASSAPPIFYQWRHNGEFVDAATNAVLVVTNAQPRDSGAYSVLVGGPEGLVVSDDALLGLVVADLTLTNRFANRVRITSAAGLGRGSNGGANLEPGEPMHAGVPGGSSVWVTWVAPSDGIATFTTEGSSIDTVLAVYVGDALSQLREVVSDDDGADFFASFLRFNATAGQAYELAIDGVYGGQGEILLNWRMDVSGARLPVILRQPVDAIVAEGATASFSLQATNPPPLTTLPTYQWYFDGNPIPNATNSSLSIPNVGARNLGLYVAVVANEAEAVLSQYVVVQINSSEGGVDSQVSTEDKFANVAREAGGQQILLRAGRPKPISLTGGSLARGYSGSQVFSTFGSTSEAGEPNHCGVVGGASQWFSYQAAADGVLTVDTIGSDFDTVLAVYTGTGVDFGSLREISCDNDSGPGGRDSRLAFNAQSGAVYFIVVDGVRGATGSARLNYQLAAQPQWQAVRVNDQLRLRLSGTAGRMFTIQSSTNLANWSPVLTTNVTTGIFEWAPPPTTLDSFRFYRSVQTP